MATPAPKITEQLRLLAAAYPDPPRPPVDPGQFAVLVEAILASQASSSGVRQVVPAVLRRYPDARRMAQADVDELAALLNVIPLHTQKAQNLSLMARRLVSHHGGRVPSTLEDLVRLPGVGRRIAQTYLAGTDQATSLPMSTHVHRVARRLGWTASDNMRHAESEVVRNVGGVIPRERLHVVAHYLTSHAKSVCLTSRPRCGDCNLFEVCPSAGTGS